MRPGLLSIFRGRDGRSIGHALAALLFVNALVVGIHAGFAAAPGANAAVLCETIPDGSQPATATDHEHDCCLTGTGATPLPLSPVADVGFVYAIVQAALPEAADRPRHFRALTHEGPRAPPVLA